MPNASAVTCPFCGCLCDDIELVIDCGKIVKVKNGCSISESKFLGYNNNRVLKPLVRKSDVLEEVSTREAIRKAAELLAGANYPLLYGWSSTSCEVISVGIELAEKLGGVIDNTSTICHGPSELSVQEVGISSCTLGQVRHRSDLVIYWGSNPWSAHPRHIERYTTFSDGRFESSEWKTYVAKLKGSNVKKKVQSAMRRAAPTAEIAEAPAPRLPPCPAIMKKGRKLIVVDVRRTRTAEVADYFLQIEPNKDYELLQVLRALVRDEEVDTDEVARIPIEHIEDVAQAMIDCSFGVIFFGLGLTMSQGKMRNVDAALSLTRDLNRFTKFVIIPMRGHFNVSGADTVFTWQTGYPFAVDFSLGYPRYNPGETTAVDVLLRKESDAALIVASDPVANFPRKAAQHLVECPLIVIDPRLNATSQIADVVFPSKFVGIEAEGTAYRMDHVPMPLKKVVDAPKGIMSDETILNRILSEVRRLQKGRGKGE